MRITKIGHCCLLIETKGKKILTDPGRFSTEQNKLTGIDAVLITHEHSDHFHAESLREVIRNNPHVEIVTNSAVAKLLAVLNIPYSILEGTNTTFVAGVSVEAQDGKHEEIYKEFGQVQNTGYFIDDILWYPGDSFHNPNKSVAVLALPVAGSWCSMSRAIPFAIQVRPQVAFPVHDGVVSNEAMEVFHRTPALILSEEKIKFVPLAEGQSFEFPSA